MKTQRIQIFHLILLSLYYTIQKNENLKSLVFNKRERITRRASTEVDNYSFSSDTNFDFTSNTFRYKNKVNKYFWKEFKLNQI